ncbi:MAG TPA: GFA family protein [Gaiellaceae bacterium]|jgi:hypothetical protein
MRTGGCLCGAVRYSVEGEPFHVGRCHCGDCRKRSGSAYTIYGQWPLSAFDVTGEYATHEGDSFCPLCGSRLFLLDPEGVEVQLGSLDDAPFELRPEAEIWIKRREPWMHEIEGAAQYTENRD